MAKRGLSAKHIEIARLTAMGKSAKSIAEALGVCKQTVYVARLKDEVKERIRQYQDARDKGVETQFSKSNTAKDILKNAEINAALEIVKQLDAEKENVRYRVAIDILKANGHFVVADKTGQFVINITQAEDKKLTEGAKGLSFVPGGTYQGESA